jgi:hypothetical protein
MTDSTMEKITDKIAALGPTTPFVSLEFFPPKTSTVRFSIPNANVIPQAN